MSRGAQFASVRVIIIIGLEVPVGFARIEQAGTARKKHEEMQLLIMTSRSYIFPDHPKV